MITEADRACTSLDIEKFFHRYQEALSNPLIQGFLNNPQHYQLFVEAIYYPSYKSRVKLDQAFQRYFIEVRLISYLSKSLSHHARDLKNRYRTVREHDLLIWDENGSNTDSSQSLGDITAAEKTDEFLGSSRSLLDQIVDPDLFTALKKLTPYQLLILENYFLHDQTLTEIANQFGVSQQAVSKTYRKALDKIRKTIKRRRKSGVGKFSE